MTELGIDPVKQLLFKRLQHRWGQGEGQKERGDFRPEWHKATDCKGQNQIPGGKKKTLITKGDRYSTGQGIASHCKAPQRTAKHGKARVWCACWARKVGRGPSKPRGFPFMLSCQRLAAYNVARVRVLPMEDGMLPEKQLYWRSLQKQEGEGGGGHEERAMLRSQAELTAQ